MVEAQTEPYPDEPILIYCGNRCCVQMKTAQVFYYGLVASFAVNVDGAFKYNNEAELSSHLLSTYKPFATPITMYGTPMEVFIEATLKRLDDLDEKHQTLTSIFELSFVWMDQFLTWNINETANINVITLPVTHVWTPFILVPNSAGDSNMDFSDTRVQVSNDGYVVAPIVQIFQTHCDVDLQAFPLDKQMCLIQLALNVPEDCIKIQDTMSAKFMQRFSKHKHSTMQRIESSQWSVDIDFEVGNRQLPGSAGTNASIAVITLSMTRNPMFYIVYLVIPTVLMAYVSTLAFLLPAASGERISLSVTVLLSYAVLLLMTSEVTPHGGTNIPYLILYIISIEFLAALNLLLTIWVLRVFNQPASKPLDGWAKLIIRRSKVDDSGQGYKEKVEDDSNQENNPWHEVSAFLDKISFAICFSAITIATIVQFVLMYT